MSARPSTTALRAAIGRYAMARRWGHDPAEIEAARADVIAARAVAAIEKHTTGQPPLNRGGVDRVVTSVTAALASAVSA